MPVLTYNRPVSLSKVLVKATSFSALGGLLFGFDTVVIAGTTHSLTVEFGLSAAALGFTVSIALWGTVAGALIAGAFGQRLDRRYVLRIIALLYLLSSFGCFFAWSWGVLILSRFIAGLAIGGSSVLVPVYLSEIAPTQWRGRLVTLFQVNVGIGVLLAFITIFLLDYFSVRNTYLWRLELGLAAIPASLFFLLLFFIPPSARWLASRGRMAEAQAALREIGSTEQQSEIEMILHPDSSGAGKSERLFSRRYLRPILLAIGIAAFNQLSGINAILYYLNDIFVASGLSRNSSNFHAILVGATNLLFCLGSMALIDTVGRRPLLLFGSLGMTACLIGAAVGLSGHRHTALLFASIVGFNFFFSASQGAIIWVYMSEIFPTSIRVKGQSLGSTVHWIMNALIAAGFPIVVKRSTVYPFTFFAVMMVVQFVLVLFVYPETKGVSLERLERELVHGSEGKL